MYHEASRVYCVGFSDVQRLPSGRGVKKVGPPHVRVAVEHVAEEAGKVLAVVDLPAPHAAECGKANGVGEPELGGDCVKYHKLVATVLKRPVVHLGDGRSESVVEQCFNQKFPCSNTC
jgi:hypothetical protein